jgi:hypothetical protein
LEWDADDKNWRYPEAQNLDLSQPDAPKLNKATTEFTTYILGRTPLWFDGFTTNMGLDSTESIDHITATGKLKLSDSVLTGTAVSTPYTPTGLGCLTQIQAWETVSYTANITTGTSLTISVESLNGEVLLTNVSPGQSLSGIDPKLYPGLRLRVDMSTTAPGTSPELLDWSILVNPGPYEACLPIILKE